VNELRGWVLGHEEELRRQREVVMMQQAKNRPRKKYYAPKKLKAALRGNAGKFEDFHPGYNSSSVITLMKWSGCLQLWKTWKTPGIF